jgi:hypothetical protein
MWFPAWQGGNLQGAGTFEPFRPFIFGSDQKTTATDEVAVVFDFGRFVCLFLVSMGGCFLPLSRVPMLPRKLFAWFFEHRLFHSIRGSYGD